jgi:hypothetical protein
MVFIFAAMAAGLMQSTQAGTLGYTAGWWQETTIRAGLEDHMNEIRSAFPYLIPASVTADTYQMGGFPIDAGVITAVLVNTGYLSIFGLMTMFLVLMFRKA